MYGVGAHACGYLSWHLQREPPVRRVEGVAYTGVDGSDTRVCVVWVCPTLAWVCTQGVYRAGVRNCCLRILVYLVIYDSG